MQEWFKNCYRHGFYYLRGFLSRHKKRLICVLLMSLAACVIGVISSSGNSEESVNYIIIMRDTGSFNIMASYFKTMLIFALCLALIFVGAVFTKAKFVGYVVLFFVAFKFGGSINCCIAEDVAIGIIYLFIYLLPVYLFVIVMFSVAICIVSEAGIGSRCSVVCKKIVLENARKIAFVFLAICAYGLIFMLFTPLIVKAIVVV